MTGVNKYLVLVLAMVLTPALLLKAQTELKIMHYNLLNYGNYTSGCTPQNNNLEDKDNYLQTIIRHIKPDVLTVNEIADSAAVMDRLANNCLNTDGIGHYRRVSFISQAGSSIVNMLYYDSRKIRFHSQYIAQSYIRDINVYRMYFYANDLETADTVFLNFVVAHLKAGSSSDDEDKREVMARNTMEFLDGFKGEEFYVLSGDFNTYNSSEAAYREFTSNQYNIRFIDPLDMEGNWHANFFYRNLHTQSTLSDGNGCNPGGGMDDRFDFIMLSSNIVGSDNMLNYTESSYEAIGQDGEHFNNSINASPTNQSVPSGVLFALASMSDHLPVILKLEVNKVLSMEEQTTAFIDLQINNPIKDQLYLSYTNAHSHGLLLELVDLTGKTYYQQYLEKQPYGRIAIDTQTLPKGVYLLRLYRKDFFVVRKIIKL